jgi:hypothetical protein
LSEKYPDLCESIEFVQSPNICINVHETTANISDPMFLKLNGSLLRLRDEMYTYARDNLAVVNIYIKDAVVTKIMRDQKVSHFFYREPGVFIVPVWTYIYKIYMSSREDASRSWPSSSGLRTIPTAKT